MPRKRFPSRRPRFADPTNGQYVNQYFLPGLYITPQVLQRTTPCSYSYLPQYEYFPQWSTCANYSTATYVVDAGGMVYYLSDLDYVLGMPGPMTVTTEVSYYYEDDGSEKKPIYEEENYAPEPPKQSRFDDNFGDTDWKEDVSAKDSKTSMQADQNKGTYSNQSQNNTGRVYRSEEGYLVEEPNDPEAAAID